jgi:hypothetical protein
MGTEDEGKEQPRGESSRTEVKKFLFRVFNWKQKHKMHREHP